MNNVYAPQNRCNRMGLETVVHVERMPNGHCIRLYVDNFQQYRIVAFESAYHSEGYSGIALDRQGVVKVKATRLDMQGKNTTRQLQAFLSALGIRWHASDCLTEAGQACYKIN